MTYQMNGYMRMNGIAAIALLAVFFLLVSGRSVQAQIGGSRGPVYMWIKEASNFSNAQNLYAYDALSTQHTIYGNTFGVAFNLMRFDNYIHPITRIEANSTSSVTVGTSGPSAPDPFFLYPVPEDVIMGTSNPLQGQVPDAYLNVSQGSNSYFHYFYMMAPLKKPDPLTSTAFNTTICADTWVMMSSSSGAGVPMANGVVSRTVLWEYSINGGNWLAWRDTEDDAYINFKPSDLVSGTPQKVSVTFRYRFRVNYRTSTFFSPYSDRSQVIEILPVAPRLTSVPVITPSCNGQATGTITFPPGSIQSPFATIKWLLREGAAAGPCDPLGVGGNACGATDKWSNGAINAANGFTITGVKGIAYTLLISNSDAGNEGACFNTYSSTVPAFPVLKINEDSHQHVSCYNASDGRIKVFASGGDTTGTYLFTLLSGRTVVRPQQPGTGRSMTWEQLPPGTYNAEVRSAICPDVVISTSAIEITQPPLIKGTLISQSPLCTSPGDGLIGVTATATGGTAVTNYVFNLYKDGVLFKQAGPIPNDAYNFTGLPGGNYKVEIMNNGVPLCTGWDSTVTLTTLIPLQLNLISRDSVSCYGGNDGLIKVAGLGGSGSYEYTLSGNNTSATNTSGNFTGLAAGDYTVTVKNRGTGCNDISTLNTEVFQRSPLTVTLDRIPISCYGKTDASISTTVNGGSGSYRYNWQQLKNGVWSDSPLWLNTDTQIGDLSAGTYRVIITDNKATGCSVTSTASTVEVATLVQVTNVTVHDAVCLANGAHIDMTATGGTGSYVYEWSLDGGSYYPFTAATDVTQTGNYTLRVTDGHGCIAAAPATYNIILPSALVSFTYSLSDYAGYNISCKGNDNGFAQIIAQGGNDGLYSGYSYALDNGTYSTSSLIEHINAGQHILYVKDGRGCVVTQQVVMTEPAAVLSLAVSEQEHPGCGADPIGHITVQASGGTMPYSYSIDNSVWQDQSIFEKLISRDYALRVKDAAGCMTTINTTLTSIYPPLSTTADITAVSCYGGKDGGLALHVTGGDGNYRYQWSTPSLTGNVVSNIPAGDYLIAISDSKDCRQQVTFTVPQPDPLALHIAAPGICDGIDNGSITTGVTGGTAPYRYSLDHSSWLYSGTFNGLSAGDYLVAVEDAHNCPVSQVVKIIKINVKPEVNFLVASRMNAFDTLAIKEISLPAPDEVHWAYHPAATFLGNDNGTPLIKFTDPGTYWIEMSGKFGECTYTLRKELEIGAYDPQAGPGYSLPVQVIDTVTMSPNPNNGTFNFRIKLNRKQQVVAYVYDMNGIVWGKKQYAPTLEVNDVFTAGGDATGTFILRIIAESESKDVRFIISR